MTAASATKTGTMVVPELSGERFVVTAEVREAAIGQEEDILDRLGIPFRDGRPHIRCPYPDHGGDGDWRWHSTRARAICTCTKGDSIFDVVMKCEAVSFDEAKIFVAEEIGRSDLVRTKKSREADPDNKYQKSTVAGLMSVRQEFRDDHLVAAYLAHRMGVADDEVLLPSTPVRGITKMPYWEGGGSRGSKPKLVGSFPCAVFVQIGADRKTHAHRIYLAPGGHGKADLGETKSGLPRDPKKSAKKTSEDDNSAGRAVIWGDPTKAPHVIIAEGIETAAAIAFAFRDEIQGHAVVVASAISAVGVEEFSPWPATKKVTIAGDRDDAEKRGKAGSQRGEAAARKFCVGHLDLETLIALPGSNGDTLDWLDVFTEGGEQSVRQGIERASQFHATAEEKEAQRRSVNREAEVAETAVCYPLPELATKTLLYAHDQNDRLKVHKVATVKDPVTNKNVEALVPVMTPMGIVARLRNADYAGGYGLRIVVQDMGGQARNIDLQRRDLSKMNASDIRSMLFEAGLRVEDDGEAIAVQMLKAADPRDEIIIVKQPAWHEVDDAEAPIFIAPNGEVFGAPEDIAVELDVNVAMRPDVAKAGTFEAWKTAAAKALAEEECPHWAIGLMAAFAGPLIAVTKLDTCGVNLSGRSSSGKTTAQRLGVSAWSSPDVTKAGLAQSARATGNAIEALCQRATGTILSLDELAHVSGKEAGKMVYTIAGGVGKARMKADSSIRDSYRWSTFAILSAETSLQEKIESDGESFMAGMAVRIVDVDVTGINRNVDKATMQAIEQVNSNYGHAGPAFVEAMIADGTHLAVEKVRDEISRRSMLIAGDRADSALVRAATPFAVLLLAGQMAQDVGILPSSVDLGRAIAWAWSRFQRSSDAEVLNPADRSVTNLRLWIAERWNVTVRSVDAENSNQISSAWYDADFVYIPKDRLREAAGDALKEQELVALLDEKGVIGRREDEKRAYIRYVPKVGKINCYALSRRMVGRSSSTFDQDAFRVFDGGQL